VLNLRDTRNLQFAKLLALRDYCGGRNLRSHCTCIRRVSYITTAKRASKASFAGKREETDEEKPYETPPSTRYICIPLGVIPWGTMKTVISMVELIIAQSLMNAYYCPLFEI